MLTSQIVLTCILKNLHTPREANFKHRQNECGSAHNDSERKSSPFCLGDLLNFIENTVRLLSQMDSEELKKHNIM